MNRRSFVASAGASWLISAAGAPVAALTPTPTAGNPRRIESFDYRGVTLLPGRMLDQATFAHDFYFAMSDDDMLKGFRRAAGLPAPGADMKGWCKHDCGATFGQWLSGMARMSRATNDAAMRAKAIHLVTEWEKTLGPGGDPRMGTYAWEKMACGLVDCALYADHPHSLEILARITDWATQNFDRSRSPATVTDRDGRRPHGTLEWYTLGENSLRAYAATGDRRFLDFANLWLYPAYWDQFASSKRPAHAALLHSYSHMNTFNSAAMVYAVTRDPRYLAILRNAYDWARETQTFASGGYGPGEWSVPDDGSLGASLDTRLDTAEIPCGSWAGFKLSRYLTEFTGEARFGDWIETLLFNGIGAALPIQPDGRSFYYADYRVGMGAKTFFWDEWPCCSGTFIQAIADYYNILYYRDADGLYVNLTQPSTATWTHHGAPVRVTQRTRYPEEAESLLTIERAPPTQMAIRVRIPDWCRNATLAVNGAVAPIVRDAGGWAVVTRAWRDGDVLAISFPMAPRLLPVDRAHPDRVAILYGPVLMAQDARFTYPVHGPRAAVLASLHRKPEALELAFDAGVDPRARQGGQQVGDLKPFWTFGERQPYRSTFDLDRPRFL